MFTFCPQKKTNATGNFFLKRKKFPQFVISSFRAIQPERKGDVTMKPTTNGRAGKRDKVFTVIGIVLCVILIPMLIINVTMIVESYIHKDKVPGFLGMTPLIVLTDSMADTIYSGDMIVCFDIEADDVEKGDIISFYDPASSTGAVVTHRVIDIIENEDGTRSFITKGDNNNTEDKKPVPGENLIGEYQMRIPAAGHVAMFMQTPVGLILCVFIPLVLLVGYDIIRRRFYEQNKQQNVDDLMAELEALRAEKAKAESEAENTDEATENDEGKAE